MAKDRYHELVKKALQDLDWLITDDPLYIPILKRKLEVDLGAEKLIAAERGIEKIAVEIKSFIGSSRTYDFHSALGQYNVYQFFMEDKDPNRQLYLAITDEVFDDFFQEADTQAICDHFKLKLVVFNADNKIIKTWLGR